MDKNYLKFFCLCFKCLEFFHKKKYKKNRLDNLNTNTTQVDCIVNQRFIATKLILCLFAKEFLDVVIAETSSLEEKIISKCHLGSEICSLLET